MSTSAEHAFAIVHSVESDGLRLKFDGEEAAGEKSYKCNTFFKFAPGDRVYCVKDSGTFVAICKIGEPSGKIETEAAKTAEYAENAKTAEYAENAKTAESVNSAEYATSAGRLVANEFEGWAFVVEREGGEMYYRCPDTMTKKPLMGVRDLSVNANTMYSHIVFRTDNLGDLQYKWEDSDVWKTLANK